MAARAARQIQLAIKLGVSVEGLLLIAYIMSGSPVWRAAVPFLATVTLVS